MRIAYFDCIAGISGDMALGALIDAGVDFDEVQAQLRKLPVEPFSITLEETESGGIRATRVSIRTETAGIIRTYGSIRSLLDSADLPPDALRIAQRIFYRLAKVEAKIHRKNVDHVTFHEIGAVDSIVDIAGVALAVAGLGIERAFASPVPTGMGMTKSEHGALPIPAPAVVELLQGAPLYSRGVPVELVTPTGAAILATLVEGYGEMPMMRVESVGYGAGSHRLDFPNVLRVIVGDDVPSARGKGAPAETGEIVLETNVDDLNPELYAYVLERLFEAGAQDAWLTPIVMKKGRPAVTVSVLCSPERGDDLRRVLFRETGTLGVRSQPTTKRALDREPLKVETAYGPVAVKIGRLEGRAVTVAPEFEDCARVARDADVPARDVYEEAVRLAREKIEGSQHGE